MDVSSQFEVPTEAGELGGKRGSVSPATDRHSIVDLVLERSAADPDAIAIEDGERVVRYAELDALSAGVASGLREAGVGEEEVVGVCLPRSWRAVCAFLACLRAGAAYVPISPDYPPLRKRQLLELAGVRRVLTDFGRVDGFPPECECLDLETLSRQPGDIRTAPGGDRLAYVLFTSGSTGTPKGVEITHANLSHLFATGSALLPVEGDAVLAVAPTEFDIAALETWGALVTGARLVIVPPGRPDPRAVGRLIAGRGVTFAFFAAGFFEQVVRAAVQDLGGMRLIAAGGDVMAPAAAAAVLAAHPQVRVLNGYGPTETSIVASSFEVEAVDGAPLPIGRPLHGYEFHVLDERMQPVPAGEPGELWIGGPGVARGYRGDPARTEDRFRPDPFSGLPDRRIYGSGDLVRLREDGELLFLGRTDHQVKIAGHRVEPGEVEQVLGAHPDVAQAGVVAREDVAGHKRLVAYAALRAGSEADAEQLREHLAERLPAFMLPSTITLLPELPLTERGKIDRTALPDPGREAAAGEPASGPAGAVARLMAELLGLEEVGADEDFFALGGDSLLAIQLVGRLRDRLDADVEVGAVFDAPTPRRLSARLEHGGGLSRPPLRRAAHATGVAPVTFAQRRAWLHERMNPESLSFQFAALIHLEGDLDEEALRGALGDLIQRHEILRTSIEERDGEPVQVVHDEVELPFEVVDLPDEDGIEWARLVRTQVRTRIQLDRAPLVRWTLVRRGPSRWSLIDLEHHAVHDGWSFMLVLAELAELYSSRVENRAPGLPELPVQLSDFAHWERRVVGKLEQSQLNYWRRQLDPHPRLLELPAARPRPARESFLGSSVRRRLPRELAERVRALAREEGVTPFMVGLAAFATLLGRVGECEDVQIGSGLANRRDPAADSLVGMTVGTVALRIDLSGDPTISSLLKRVKATVLDGIANADVPFERVVETLAPDRQASRSPLVQTLFSFDDAPAVAGDWRGVDVRVVQTVPNGSAKADLNVIGVDHGDGDPFFIWEHSDLLTDAAADSLAGQHLRLLEQFAAEPATRLSALGLAPPEEERRLLALGRNDEGFDRESTIPGLIERQASLRPDAVAIRDGEEVLSYADLVARARAAAGALRRRGVTTGDPVPVLMPRSARLAAAQLGVLMAGGAYVPLDPTHPAPRMRRALEDAGARVALADPAELATMLPADVAVIDPQEAFGGEPIEEPAAGPEDLAYLMYTSGSTGEPKGVEVTHRNVIRLVDDPAYIDLGPGTVMLNAASPAFDAATLEIWGPLANGGTIAVLAEQPAPDAIAGAIAEHGVTTLWLTAGLFHELVDRRPDCLAGVRHLLAGGDVLSPDHVARALAALPADARLTNGYGPTETTTFALTHDLRPGDQVPDAIPLGRPIQATTCDVVDACGQLAPEGVPGELWIGGDGVSRGYRSDPQLTAERFVPDPRRPGGRCYRTGDRVRRLPDGTIAFLGRGDRQLKVRGVRVEPGEIEQTLRRHPGVADAVVVPYEPQAGERALAAYVVPVAAKPAPDPEELREHAVAELPAAFVPTAWVPLDSLPLTPNGKVDRERLPAPSREHLASGGRSPQPRNEREAEVIAIFESVLGVEGIGAEDDFFALGGHSLLAVGVFKQLEELSGRRLPLVAIFDAPTPRALATMIGKGVPRDKWDNLVPLKPSGWRPPLFAVTAGDGNAIGFGPLARAVSSAQPFYALQPSGLDGQSTIDKGIEAMAARCVEEIRTVQPEGPYLLAGRCNGATVAFEIAQQLRRAGEEVPLLAALDSDPPYAGPAELEAGIPLDPLMETAWARAASAGAEVPDLDRPGGWGWLAAWLRGEVAPDISRYGHEIWHWREDLQQRWPDPLGRDAQAFAKWLWESGHPEQGLEPRLLVPAPYETCRLPNGREWDWAMDAAWRSRGRLPADPLSSKGWKELRRWLAAPLDGGHVNRYLLGAWERPDLRATFPDPAGADSESFRWWAWSEGIDQGLWPALLPAPPGRVPRRARVARARDALERAAGRFLFDVDRERLCRLQDEVAGQAERMLDRPLPRARRRTDERIIRAARRARANYRAEPWPGKVVLLTSAEYEDKAAYISWPRRAAGGVEKHTLPVGHVEMMRESGATHLARCLEECIAQVLDR